MPRILADFQLLKHSLPRQAKTLFFAPAGRIFSAEPGPRFGGLVAGFGLLCFHRFAFPSSRHALHYRCATARISWDRSLTRGV